MVQTITGKKSSWVVCLSAGLYFLIFLPTVCPAAQASPEHSDDTRDTLIAVVFRIVAKGFVAAVDLDKLKQGMAARISKTDEAYFHARYMDVYEHVREQPLFTRAYGLQSDLTRAQAIAELQSYDKPKLYAFIDAVPDVVITNEFKRYLWKKKEQVPSGNSVDNFFKAAAGMIDDFKRKYLP
jgi:hypothetical protein